ncbi:PREDICTED: caspase-like [Vollenhovia emeryi]|uniref:caspase-like n=1 Tax=Vollenhovia emeryi TaxID=411798 RepID=UPI0005F39A3E|nr:PREDICTED: caspase-like [Vollenhovia emeryi]
MLKHAYGDQCLSRAYTYALFDEYRSRSFVQISEEQYEPFTASFAVAGTSKAQANEKKIDTIDAKVTVPVTEDPTCTIEEPGAFTAVSKDADCYNMNHKNRGKCLIFNHERFNFSSQRKGSLLDAKRLEVTFRNLGFDVEIYNDFTHSKVVDMIQDVSKLDHTDNDCLCIIVLTHGSEKNMIINMI